MKERILDIAGGLMVLPTAPFREGPVRQFITAFCRARGMRVRADDMGNLVVTYGGRYRGPVWAFAAHMDHPGFIAEKDSRGGTVSALFYGKVEEGYFAGSKVRFFTPHGEVRGRVLSTQFNVKRKIQRVKLAVEGKVCRGDPGMWDLAPFRVRGDRLAARACDDLVGCVSVLALLDELRRRKVRRKVLGVFSVAEESGCNGAKYLGLQNALPARALLVAIETSRALPTARIGDGVVIRVGDRVSVFNPELTRFMGKIARRIAGRDPDFRFQRKLMDGGVCESSVYQLFGYRVGAICVPLGNYHNRHFGRGRIEAEYVSVRDLVSMVELFLGLVKASDEARVLWGSRRPIWREERRPLGERLFLNPELLG